MDQFGAWPHPSVEPVENTATTAEEDPDLQEATEAEKAAEALALDARRTWTQAQRHSCLEEGPWFWSACWFIKGFRERRKACEKGRTT